MRRNQFEDCPPLLRAPPAAMLRPPPVAHALCGVKPFAIVSHDIN